LIANTNRFVIIGKTEQIVNIKSTGGAKDDASPIARKVNIIETEETGIGIKRSSG
jgi:hypothetical protein